MPGLAKGMTPYHGSSKIILGWYVSEHLLRPNTVAVDDTGKWRRLERLPSVLANDSIGCKPLSGLKRHHGGTRQTAEAPIRNER